MDELTSRASEFVKENLLAVICFGIGLIFLAYGVMAFSSYGNKNSKIVFEGSTGGEVASGGKDESSVGKIVVDVAGAVNKPGVYRLRAKSRMEDALLAAGGVSQDADQGYIAKNVNLASVLSDGAKVYLPFIDESNALVLGSTDSGVSSSGLVNLNSASSSQLEDLPGIGEVTAGKIINARPYSAVDELRSKKVVSQKVYDEIKEKVSVY